MIKGQIGALSPWRSTDSFLRGFYHLDGGVKSKRLLGTGVLAPSCALCSNSLDAY